MDEKWRAAQEWELEWWGNCVNTYGEEEKHILYADRMGLEFMPRALGYSSIDLGNRSVIDLGAGPCSLLLRCSGWHTALVIDPLMDRFPVWVRERYIAAGIRYGNVPGEKEEFAIGWDEVWIYNVLQHVQDPALVVSNARAAAGLVRVFEWIDTGVDEAHLHVLTRESLDEWLGGEGQVEEFDGEAHCYGRAYYGVFQGSDNA